MKNVTKTILATLVIVSAFAGAANADQPVRTTTAGPADYGRVSADFCRKNYWHAACMQNGQQW